MALFAQGKEKRKSSCGRINDFGFFLSIVLDLFAQGKEKRNKVREESLVLKISRESRLGKYHNSFLCSCVVRKTLTHIIKVFLVALSLVLRYVLVWKEVFR